jgi:S1-C subfamily serine protease
MRPARLPLALLLAVCLAWAPAAAEIEPERLTPVVRAVQSVAPAVVNITASREITERFDPLFGHRDDVFGHLFGDFFGPGFERKRVSESLGSGVIIDGPRRLVLTNAHVIAGASRVAVRLLDGRNFDAELIGSDPDFDLAVLHLSGDGELPEAAMGGSDDILPGETVIAIGNPYGYNHTVTTGVVSALDRSIKSDEVIFTDLIQTDAAINPGNSGGPLLNILGRLIGLNTAIRADAQGIGFAIPIDKARRVVDEILSSGSAAQVWLGLAGQDLDQQTAAYFGLESAGGMIVTEVFADTPAEAAGLKPGDVILSVKGARIDDKDDYLDVLRNVVHGEELPVELWRGEGPKRLGVATARFGESLADALALERWGLSMAREGTPEGLAIRQVAGPARDIGLEPGDRVYQIGGMRLRDYGDFVRAVSRYRMQRTLMLRIERGGRSYHARLVLG